MIKIKLSSNCPSWNWTRQTPNNDGVWGMCQFVYNEPNEPIDTCDYWIVYENITKQETVSCPPKNTILITGEPPTIKTYHPKFLAQFGAVITCHSNLKHSNIIINHPHLPWMVGFQPPSITFTKSYGELTKIQDYPKTKLISVICSDKTFTKGHKQRLNFVKKLQETFHDTIDFYGRGFVPITDKWEAIAPYKYHIALENCSIDHYWTEKLADAYLAQSYPIYYGCPNIHEYCPQEALTTIDITKPKQAFKTIEQIIASNRYEQALPVLQEAKNLVLNTHNIFAKLSQLCTKTDLPKQKHTLQPQEYFYKQDPIIKKVIRKAKSYFSFP